MSKISVREASKILGISEQSLRCWISLSTCPFGEIIRKSQNRYGRNTYYICRERLVAYLQNEMPRSDGSHNEA